MKKLGIDLENCYGIKKLETTFDFSKESVFAIYAPNGAMKSSFALTFKDIADGSTPKDRVFGTRACKSKIVDENGAPLPKASVLVIPPYEEQFGHNEKTSTLLVDGKLRKEYEQLHADIKTAEAAFLDALKEKSRSKKDLRKEVSETFTASDKTLDKALLRVKGEVADQKDAPFADIEYDTVFDEKVLTMLGTKDVKKTIEEYVRKYNELLAASTYFKKGIFNYYNAATIAKNLADNGFFDAKHSVSLNADEKVEITSQKQLEEIITKEKEKITTDKDLRKKYAEIAKLIEKNKECRGFEAYLGNHEEILAKLENIDAFKEEVWKSYFRSLYEMYAGLIAKYEAVDKRKKEIEAEAGKQRTQWEEVIRIFNERFIVPFKLYAKNRTSVILGEDPMLSLGFTFEDGSESSPVERSMLMAVLSTGEKKALYILNIIFEIEVRKKLKTETLLIFDDIADSFDYKNKYAIIQYLQDTADDAVFKQIILTHNFDFFRTLESRFVKYSHCLMAFRDNNGVKLSQATGIKNVFVNDWKEHFFDDAKKKLASIPFMRNIIEYTKGEADPDFIKLTSLLHWKGDSASITVSDLDAMFVKLFGVAAPAAKNGKTPVLDMVEAEAKGCLKAAAGANFENKIVLAIAIRMCAEKYMVGRIADKAFIASITANQTQKLVGRFKKDFPAEAGKTDVLQRVALMTPESIHLNSFMYEPIIDMSDDHLKQLYQDVSAL